MNDVRVVTPSADFAASLRSVYGESNGELRYWRDALTAADIPAVVRDLTQSGARVVIVGPGLFDAFAIELIDSLDRARPDIVKVLVAEPSEELWPAALRAGARDVLAPQASATQIRESLDRALDTATRQQLTDTPGGDGAPGSRVISVISPKGGVGKTTLATNLAFGLAVSAPGEAVVVDLDLQFGGIGGALGLAAQTTIADAVSSIGTVDTTTLKVFLTPHPSGLLALCAPESLAQADDLGVEHLERIIGLLTTDFRYVVIDTAAGIDVVTLAAIELSSDLVVVSTTDVPCARSVRRALDALDAIGATSQQRHLVLNRADARTGLGIADIEGAIGLPVEVALPDSVTIGLSLNIGSPVLESDPKSLAAASVKELVSSFTGEPLDAKPSRALRRLRQRAKGQL